MSEGVLSDPKKDGGAGDINDIADLEMGRLDPILSRGSIDDFREATQSRTSPVEEHAPRSSLIEGVPPVMLRSSTGGHMNRSSTGGLLQRSNTHTRISTESGKKEDYSTLLSAKAVEELQKHADLQRHEELHHAEEGRTRLPLQPSYPLPLVVFVCLLSMVAGLVVTGVHYAIVYAGCPLGLNGCNDFIESKKSKGFFFIKWVTSVSGDAIPEDLVYITCSILGSSMIATLFHFLPEHLVFQISGGGTMQSLIAVACGERITLTTAALRIIASSIYLGSGGTLGLDGPAIQVCCAATTYLGYRVGMRSVPTQSLLACLGFAGGFAATFNSPLAGILFAMEELQHVSSRLSKHIICVILMCSIVATSVSRACQGNQQLLEANWGEELFDSVGGGSLNKVFGLHMWMLVAVPIGILCSFVGFACSWIMRLLFDALYYLRFRVPRHDPFTFVVSAALVATIGSLVFNATGLRVVWGIGYESLQKAFELDLQASDYLIVAFGKLLAMLLAVVVKAPGDILEPVLISGAFLGGCVGNILQNIIEDETLAEQVLRPCLVFGMVGLFASCFRFPLTPVVIVLELMGVETYALVLPAALAGFSAITTSNRLFPPLLDEIMHEDDVDPHELSEEADAWASEEHEVYNSLEDNEQEPEPEVQDTFSARGSGNSNNLCPTMRCVPDHLSDAPSIETAHTGITDRTHKHFGHILSRQSSRSYLGSNLAGGSRRGSVWGAFQSVEATGVFQKLESSALALATGEGSRISQRRPSKAARRASTARRKSMFQNLNQNLNDTEQRRTSVFSRHRHSILLQRRLSTAPNHADGDIFNHLKRGSAQLPQRDPLPMADPRPAPSQTLPIGKFDEKLLLPGDIFQHLDSASRRTSESSIRPPTEKPWQLTDINEKPLQEEYSAVIPGMTPKLDG